MAKKKASSETLFSCYTFYMNSEAPQNPPAEVVSSELASRFFDRFSIRKSDDVFTSMVRASKFTSERQDEILKKWGELINVLRKGIDFNTLPSVFIETLGIDPDDEDGKDIAEEYTKELREEYRRHSIMDPKWPNEEVRKGM